MKSILILAGPQGSGNHLFSKIFGLHPEVFGWKSLIDSYWETHRSHEPFRELWKNQDLISDFDWSVSEYFVTSVSLPFGLARRNNLFMPDVNGFIKALKAKGFNVQLAVIGRDKNIIEKQEQRVRNEITLPLFLEQLKTFDSPCFLSQELLYLYKQDYLRSLNLGIPIAFDDERVNEILANDANQKYIIQPPTQNLDRYIQGL